MNSASPSRPRTGSPPSLTTSSAIWYQWLDHTEAADDLARPDLTDPALLAASGLINATQPAAYFAGDPATVTWLGLEALRICLEHGPAPALVGPVAYTAFGAVALRGDYAAGYRAARRILALGEARGYEPGTSQARMHIRCPQLLGRADRKQCPCKVSGQGRD